MVQSKAGGNGGDSPPKTGKKQMAAAKPRAGVKLVHSKPKVTSEIDSIREDVSSLAAKTAVIYDRVEGLTAMMDKVGDALVVLGRIEERQIAAAKKIEDGREVADDHSVRLSAIEQTLPGLKEIRRLLIAGVVGVFGILATALSNYALEHGVRGFFGADTGRSSVAATAPSVTPPRDALPVFPQEKE